MMNKTLLQILPPPNISPRTHQWNQVETELHVCLPDDYKQLIETYGCGSINEFLWFLSPFVENEWLNLNKRFKFLKDAHLLSKEVLPQYTPPYNFYDGETGLFPWAFTDNGDVLYWNFGATSGEVVVINSRNWEYDAYQMDISDFLVLLLENKLESKIFPPDFVREENYFSPLK